MAIEYAAELVTIDAAQLASWRGSATGSTVNVVGPCPVCGHEAPNQVPRQITSLDRPATPRSGVTTQLACTCTEDHPGRPAGVTAGCGRTWFVVATVEAYGTVALAPVAAPPAPAVATAAQALRAAGTRQLTDVRAAAEKWIGGVTGLFGLFGLAGVLTARSTLTTLGAGWEAAIAVTAVSAVALGALAVYRIYRAAYGWPVTYPITNEDELLAWYGTQQSAPRVQAGFLRGGVRVAAAALAMLVVTAGLLLFAPGPSPDLPSVRVTLTGGAQVCGTLLSTTPGTTLIRRASDGAAIVITPRSIVSETVVAAC